MILSNDIYYITFHYMSFDIFVYAHYMFMFKHRYRIEIKVIDPQGVIIPYQTENRRKELSTVNLGQIS